MQFNNLIVAPLASIVLIVLTLATVPGHAAETPTTKVTTKATTTSPLPNPLTLQQALALTDESHPDLALARAQIDDAQAQLYHAQSFSGLRSYLDINAETKKLTTTGEFENDSNAILTISKPIFDFGRTQALEDSKSALINSREHLLLDAKLRHQLEITRLFYNVILADMRYRVDNEEMVQRFLKFDKKRERHSLGMISEVELSKAENYYREAIIQRTISETDQHSSRLLLAIALNRPDDLPAELVKPDTPESTKAIPDGSELFTAIFQSNETILALKQEVQSAHSQLKAERARAYPTISAEFQLADYERDFSTRGDITATLNFHFPIYQGKEKKAEITRAAAALASKTAQLQKAKQNLLKTVTGLTKKLTILKTQRTTALQRIEFRDLSLEHRRAEYELELQTNMSEAQARITEALWFKQKTDFDISLTWANIDMLFGDAPTHKQSAQKLGATTP